MKKERKKGRKGKSQGRMDAKEGKISRIIEGKK